MLPRNGERSEVPEGSGSFRGIAIRTTETSGSRLVTQFLGRVVTFDGFGDDRASRVTLGEILTLRLHHSGDVAARQCNATHAE